MQAPNRCLLRCSPASVRACSSARQGSQPHCLETCKAQKTQGRQPVRARARVAPCISMQAVLHDRPRSTPGHQCSPCNLMCSFLVIFFCRG